MQPATVSRVLNSVDVGFSVKPETREAIISTARKLGYVPNIAAKNLRRSKTDLIAIYGYNLRFGLSRENYAVMLASAIDQLQEKGYTVNMVFSSDRNMATAPLTSDGAIILNSMDTPIIEDFSRRNIPFVVLNDRVENVSCVAVDDRRGMCESLDYLASLGHRRIAYRNASPKLELGWHRSIADRHDAYAEWMREKELPVYTDFPEHLELDDYIDKLLKFDCTAVVVYDDISALMLSERCRQRGVDIPGRLSIVAFNASINSAGVDLTSMWLPGEQIGRLTAEILLTHIAGYKNVCQKVLPLCLHVGNTTGPVRDS